MSKWQKQSRPVDRALTDLNRKIESVERQLREMGHETRSQREAAPAQSVPVAPRKQSWKSFFRELLTPPSARSAAPTRNARQDLFDPLSNPMQDLDPEPIAFVPATNADLFAAGATAPRSASASHAGEKLVHYLAAGSLKIPKPTLKRVQRETRNRFFMWLGLSALVIWLIVVVIR